MTTQKKEAFEVGDIVGICMKRKRPNVITEGKVVKVFQHGELGYNERYYIINVFTEDFQGLKFRGEWEVFPKQ